MKTRLVTTVVAFGMVIASCGGGGTTRPLETRAEQTKGPANPTRVPLPARPSPGDRPTTSHPRLQARSRRTRSGSETRFGIEPFR